MGKQGGARKPKKHPLQLQQAAALVSFRPQGKGTHKRTPKTITEQQELAQEDFFEPEKVLVRPSVCPFVPVSVHTCVRACVRACMRVCVCACVHVCMRACVSACRCACVDSNTCVCVLAYV